MLGQPNNYSDILKRIFMASIIVGLICTLSLGYFSPEIKNLFNLSSRDWDLGPIALPIIPVMIPLIVALLSRIIKLHDRISDILKIREKFDNKIIITGLAKGVGFNFDEDSLAKIKSNRDTLMVDIFYKYVPDVNRAEINSQIVANAMDQWAWFWSFVEPSVLILVSFIISIFLIDFAHGKFFLIGFIIFVLIALLLYQTCKKASKKEVDEILKDELRQTDIRARFNEI